MSEPESKAEPSLEQQMRDMLQRLSQAQPATAEPEVEPVADWEKRLYKRLNSTETYLVNQMEEQALAIAFMIGLFVISALYILYFLLEKLAHRYRCRCPQLEGWEAVVKAAQFSLRVEAAQQQQAASTVPAAPAVSN